MKKILFASSELYPLIKTGGLADFAYGFTRALKNKKYDVVVTLPGYREVLEKIDEQKVVAEIPHEEYPTQIIESQLSDSKIKLWLIHCPALFDIAGSPYSDEHGNERHDSAQRFNHFCHMICEIAMDRIEQRWKPDIVHCNDWQCGLIPAYLQKEVNAPATLFTIHNLGYQGNFPAHYFEALNIPAEWRNFESLEFYEQISFIKGGLVFADQITTVSPSYALDIQTDEFGWGMQGLLFERSNDLSGILNGVDYNVWSPQTDTLIDVNFSADSLDEKSKNKTRLQKELGLKQGKSWQLFGFIGRMAEQKGIELLIDAMKHSKEALADQKTQWVILGSGSHFYTDQLKTLAEQYPESISVCIEYNEVLAHRIEASADCLVMPSYYEPCGLNQLYSLKYGTIPVVSNTGGLKDSVIHTDKETLKTDTATGFLFERGNHETFNEQIEAAAKLFKSKKKWKQVQLCAMRQDFSWNNTVKSYIELYKKAAAKDKNAALRIAS